MAEERHAESWSRTIRLVAPGTQLREALDNIVRARTGALIVVSDSPEVMKLVTGGFPVEVPMVPAILYELAKMDGAIVLNRDATMVRWANSQLVPDPAISSEEAGIRHRTAERVARQTGELVIAVSQRRNTITLYRGNLRYVLPDMPEVLAKANQALQTLEKYRSVWESDLERLTYLELEDTVVLADVLQIVQRAEMMARIVVEVEGHVAELGSEGWLVSLELRELQAGVQELEDLVLADYLPAEKDIDEVREELARMSREALRDIPAVARTMGFPTTPNFAEARVFARGFRVLRSLPHLPAAVVENLVKAFGRLNAVAQASLEQLDEVEGIGEVRARTISEGLKRMREELQRRTGTGAPQLLPLPATPLQGAPPQVTPPHTTPPQVRE